MTKEQRRTLQEMNPIQRSGVVNRWVNPNIFQVFFPDIDLRLKVIRNLTLIICRSSVQRVRKDFELEPNADNFLFDTISLEKNEELLKIATSFGSISAASICYEKSKIISNRELSDNFVLMAAEAGNPHAMNTLGSFVRGEG